MTTDQINVYYHCLNSTYIMKDLFIKAHMKEFEESLKKLVTTIDMTKVKMKSFDDSILTFGNEDGYYKMSKVIKEYKKILNVK